MPAIAINLGQIETFESLPFGTYFGELEAIIYKPAREQGKFPQLQARYLVIDGEQLGRKQSEWLSLSPKAMFRLKAWLIKFGVGDDEELVIDDESPEEPLNIDLLGSRLIFAVFQDPKDASRIRTELQSVEETAYQGVVAQVPVAQPRARVAAPVAAPAPPRRAVAPKPAPAPVAEEELEVIEEPEAEEAVEPEPAPAPAPRRVIAPKPAAAPAAAPVRRTLR